MDLTSPPLSSSSALAVRQVPLQLHFVGDSLVVSSPDKALDVEPDLLTYKLRRTEEHLLVEFLFPTEVDGQALTVTPTDGGELGLLALNQEREVELSFGQAELEAASKPKWPTRPLIRVRPAGGG